MGTTATVTHAQRLEEERLVQAHLPLVQYAVNEIAHRVPRQVHRSDLTSAAMLGLAQAARSFDPDRGIPFDRFASQRIKGALLDELRDRDWASRSVRAKARLVRSTSDELTARLGRAPSEAELGAVLEVEPDSVKKLHEDVHRATVLNYESLSFEGPAESFLVSTDEGPEEAIVARERRAYLTDAIAALPERLRKVVVQYFFEQRPMQEIAEELHVSESRVSQLRAEALGLLKDGMNAQLDPDQVRPERRPNGRVARRKRAYYERVARQSEHAERVSEVTRSVHEKVAAAV